MSREEIEYLKEQVAYFEDLFQKSMHENLKLKVQIIDLEDELKKRNIVKNTRKISDADVEEIKKLRKIGLSYSKISEKTKWSKFTIGRVLKGVYDES